MTKLWTLFFCIVARTLKIGEYFNWQNDWLVAQDFDSQPKYKSSFINNYLQSNNKWKKNVHKILSLCANTIIIARRQKHLVNTRLGLLSPLLVPYLTRPAHGKQAQSPRFITIIIQAEISHIARTRLSCMLRLFSLVFSLCASSSDLAAALQRNNKGNTRSRASESAIENSTIDQEHTDHVDDEGSMVVHALFTESCSTHSRAHTHTPHLLQHTRGGRSRISRVCTLCVLSHFFNRADGFSMLPGLGGANSQFGCCAQRGPKFCNPHTRSIRIFS